MEIFTLLDTLEDNFDKSRNLPFSGKTIVDKEELLELLKEIRLKLPDELKQAKWVKEERQRILVEAQKEADDIVKEAENRIIAMIDEHEITKKAYDQKAESSALPRSAAASHIWQGSVKNRAEWPWGVPCCRTRKGSGPHGPVLSAPAPEDGASLAVRGAAIARHESQRRPDRLQENNHAGKRCPCSGA